LQIIELLLMNDRQLLLYKMEEHLRRQKGEASVMCEQDIEIGMVSFLTGGVFPSSRIADEELE